MDGPLVNGCPGWGEGGISAMGRCTDANQSPAHSYEFIAQFCYLLQRYGIQVRILALVIYENKFTKAFRPTNILHILTRY